MQVEREHAVGAGFDDHVGDQLGGDRRARPRLTVLARITEIGNDRGDAARGGTFQRIDNDQQFHQMVVGGCRGRLDDEHVLAADVLLHLDENLVVREPADDASGKRRFEVAGDRLGEGAVAVACNQFHRSLLSHRA
jgi:hypothetical protein